MPRENVRMPSSSAGVMSFYDEERSRIKIRPSHVVILCVAIGLAVVLLEVFKPFG